MTKAGVAVHVHHLNGFELSVVKWNDGWDSAFTVAWSVVGAGVFLLSAGWLGWTVDPAEARWLVRLQEDGSDELRTMCATLTRRGARRRARRILRLLERGDVESVRALPDTVF